MDNEATQFMNAEGATVQMDDADIYKMNNTPYEPSIISLFIGIGTAGSDSNSDTENYTGLADQDLNNDGTIDTFQYVFDNGERDGKLQAVFNDGVTGEAIVANYMYDSTTNTAELASQTELEKRLDRMDNIAKTLFLEATPQPK